MDEPGSSKSEQALEKKVWALYRNFFDQAEKTRRWSIRDAVPWERVTTKGDPAFADVIESFYGVKSYLPDYLSKTLRLVRPSRGRAWFYANWGYEESRHALALGDWLVKSGRRSAGQLADFETAAFRREWQLPYDTRLGITVYDMTRELACWVACRNLHERNREREDDPALGAILTHVMGDERAHFDFLLACVQLLLDHDRPATLGSMRRVMRAFTLPALRDLLPDGERRAAAVRELGIFDDGLYSREVYAPILKLLGVSPAEMGGEGDL